MDLVAVRKRTIGVALAALALFAVGNVSPVSVDSAAAASRKASAKRGLKVAREWCTDCHVVRRGRKRRPGGEAPSFQEVADRPSTTRAKLRRILRQPHNKMPTEPLYKDEVADLIAYLWSLKRR